MRAAAARAAAAAVAATPSVEEGSNAKRQAAPPLPAESWLASASRVRCFSIKGRKETRAADLMNWHIIRKRLPLSLAVRSRKEGKKRRLTDDLNQLAESTNVLSCG
jgi:hypothetical protein